jgi:hypothetical protein
MAIPQYFDHEIAAVVRNKSLMRLLEKRSKETTTVPLSEVRSRLNGKKSRHSARKPRSR